MADNELLEARLRSLGRKIEYPETPDLRRAVEQRIGGGNRQWRWLAAAAAILFAAGLLTALLPPVRDVVAQWIGFGRIRVERVHSLPSPTPAQPNQVVPDLHLGEPVTLAEASSRLGRRVLVPTSLGTPDLILWSADLRFASLVYRPRPDLPEAPGTGVAVLIIEAAGDVDYPILFKMVGPGTRLEAVTVQGVKGGWLEGAPHAVVFLDPTGKFRTDDVRLAGNVLIWSRAGVTYRIESHLSKERTLAIAESLN